MDWLVAQYPWILGTFVALYLIQDWSSKLFSRLDRIEQSLAELTAIAERWERSTK